MVNSWPSRPVASTVSSPIKDRNESHRNDVEGVPMGTRSSLTWWRKIQARMGMLAAVAALGASAATPAAAVGDTNEDGSARPQIPTIAPMTAFSNGSFETPLARPNSYTTFGEGQPSKLIGPWNVVAGNVDLIAKGYWEAADGDQSVDLSGTQAGTIEQLFTTVPGKSYMVSFALAGNPDGPPFLKRGHVEVNLVDVVDFQFNVIGHTRSSMGYVTNSFTFLGTTEQTSLRFVSTTPGEWGPVIDNVMVTQM